MLIEWKPVNHRESTNQRRQKGLLCYQLTLDCLCVVFQVRITTLNHVFSIISIDSSIGFPFLVSVVYTLNCSCERNDRFDLKLVGFCNPIQISGFNEFPLARSFSDIDFWFGIAKLGVIHENI